jgi:hypothetical protein
MALCSTKELQELIIKNKKWKVMNVPENSVKFADQMYQ